MKSIHAAWRFGVVAWLASQGATAEPSFWERVSDPKAARAHAILRIAERERESIEPEYASPEAETFLNQKAALGIEFAGGTELGSPELSFLLGESLVLSGPPHDERGRAVLLQALSEDPKSPRAARAWELIATVARRSGELETEYDAYGRALDTEWDADVRAVLYLRRGRASMHRRVLSAAVRDFRAALGESPHPETRALAEWSLAVALDRSFDLPSALPRALSAAAARFGSAGTQTALELDWFALEPRYEAHYYRALGLLAQARESHDEPDYVGSLQASQLLWLSYIKAAPEDDPWLPRAHQHLERLRLEIANLLKAAE